LIASKLIQILQGSYTDPTIYHPEYLRNEVIALYGVEQFQKTFSGYLEKFFRQQD